MRRRIVCGLLFAAPLFGQNTLIVQSGLAGAFQTLTSAVAAAQDGDTIRIVATPFTDARRSSTSRCGSSVTARR